MKKKVYNTTDFYKKPSEALSFVKDGGIVFLGYKKMKEPFAVLTSFKDYTETKSKNILSAEKGKSLLDRVKVYQYSDPTCKDSTKYIRKQREKE